MADNWRLPSRYKEMWKTAVFTIELNFTCNPNLLQIPDGFLIVISYHLNRKRRFSLDLGELCLTFLLQLTEALTIITAPTKNHYVLPRRLLENPNPRVTSE